MSEQRRKLLKVVGRSAYLSLVRGGVLKVWRCSSPWNWWVEGTRGQMHWHSDRHNGHAIPLGLFKLVSDSEERAVGFRDEGPALTVYRLATADTEGGEG